MDELHQCITPGCTPFFMSTNHRTRIKICGLTREEDVLVAVSAGADALGFVFYEKSPRFILPESAAALLARVPAFVTTVGLFVNADPDRVAGVLKTAPVSVLQFHGDESVADCARIAETVGKPFLKAVRVKPGTRTEDLIELEQECRASSTLFNGLLLDAYVDGYGGGGKVFDWSLIPEKLAPRVVLSGGLSAQNAADAVSRVRPCAVDVSSGVESAKGIKDAQKIHAFIRQVGAADSGSPDDTTH